MNRRQVSFVLSGLVLLGDLSGCGCPNNYRSGYVYPPRRDAVLDNPFAANGPMPPRYVPNPPPGVPSPNPSAIVAPLPGVAEPNPPVVAPPPPAPVMVPPGGIAPPGQASPPPAAAIQQNNYIAPGPSTPSSPSPVAPSVYLEQPQPVSPTPSQPRANDAAPPETRPYMPPSSEPPPARDDRAASPALPVDIPQFTMVKTNVANGQEPLADGIAWLKKHGYRSALHVRAPAEKDDDARKQYEQAGLRYVSLELSPEMLTKETVDKFNRLVGDDNNLPRFVYDKDGSLAGALWYVHFRLVDRATPEKAREEAERLGFKPERGEAFLKMWLAVQKLLNDLKP
jgi:protein tyrosine phosphatase (PTP) superfamily phosphohydrolase (DUF442 family)